MNRLPSHETVERLRGRYPRGTIVELVQMNDPYTSLKPGDRGEVMHVDDIATIHVQWRNGSTLGVAHGEDSNANLNYHLCSDKFYSLNVAFLQQ